MSNKNWYYNKDDNTYCFPEINKVAKGNSKILLSDEDINSSEFLTSLITNGSFVMADGTEDTINYSSEELDKTHKTYEADAKETPEDEYLHNPEQQALILGGDDTIIESLGGATEDVSLDPRIVNSRVQPNESKKKI